MTIFGIIWIICLIVAFCLDVKYLFILTILSSTLQCDNVIIIGNNGIGPQIITSIVFIIKVISLKKFDMKLRINKKFLNLEFACIFLAIIAGFSLIINNVLSDKLLRYLQLIIYIICFIAMSKISKYIDENFIHKSLKGITYFLLIVGFIQLLITTGKIPRLEIFKILLYNDTLSDVIYFTRDNYFRILSTFMEPSYYAGFLVGIFYYFLISDKNDKVLLTLIFIQIILSFSTTAYLSFASVGIVYFFNAKNLKKKFKIAIIAIIMLMIFYFGFYRTLDMVIFSKFQSGSANARFAWDKKAIRIFETNKIIGVGYKTSRASSMICTVLAEMGILGLISVLNVNFQVFKEIFEKKGKINSLKELGIRMAILAMFISQIIAIPDIDNCSYWMLMNILAVLISLRTKKEESFE